jgi:hypothetical protein
MQSLHEERINQVQSLVQTKRYDRKNKWTGEVSDDDIFSFLIYCHSYPKADFNITLENCNKFMQCSQIEVCR